MPGSISISVMEATAKANDTIAPEEAVSTPLPNNQDGSTATAPHTACVCNTEEGLGAGTWETVPVLGTAVKVAVADRDADGDADVDADGDEDGDADGEADGDADGDVDGDAEGGAAYAYAAPPWER